jgi:hypothetical protein
MTTSRSALPRFSSFAGLQTAADAAGLAFVAAADDDKSVQAGKWRTPALFLGGVVLAIAIGVALACILA